MKEDEGAAHVHTKISKKWKNNELEFYYAPPKMGRIWREEDARLKEEDTKKNE